MKQKIFIEPGHVELLKQEGKLTFFLDERQAKTLKEGPVVIVPFDMEAATAAVRKQPPKSKARALEAMYHFLLALWATRNQVTCKVELIWPIYQSHHGIPFTFYRVFLKTQDNGASS